VLSEPKCVMDPMVAGFGVRARNAGNGPPRNTGDTFRISAMCTLVLAHCVVPVAPIVVIANRDEFMDRPSRAPGLLRTSPVAFGGRDDVHGGTWFGINEHGLAVGITNLTGLPFDPSRRSRGLLCLDLLGLKDSDEVRDKLVALRRGEYNGFNIIASDGKAACRARYRGKTATVVMLAPGIHATTNWPEDPNHDHKRLRAEELMREVVSVAASVPDLIQRLTRAAGTHDNDGDPRFSLCSHARRYGTRASTVLLSGGKFRTWIHAEGAPCTEPYQDLSEALESTLRLRK
jgi:uncharacterized protein with NRDE domain